MCRSILGFGPGHPLDRFSVSPCLPRTVLILTTRPSFSLSLVHLSATISLLSGTEPRVCGTLLQDRERQGCRDRAHRDVLEAKADPKRILNLVQFMRNAVNIVFVLHILTKCLQKLEVKSP